MVQTDIMSIRGDGWIMEVVGESHYQVNLERICGPRKREGEEKQVRARLLFESDNPYDKFAVRVDVNDLTVGYLSRDDARDIRRMVKKKAPRGTVFIGLECDAEIVGGWDRGNGERGHYGVRLDLAEDLDDAR